MAVVTDRGGENRKSRRRLWLALHGWFALPVWLLLFEICVTGTLLTVAHELVWLVDPTVRASNPDSLPRKSLDEVVAAVAAAYPEGIVTSFGQREPYLAVDVTVALPHAPFARAHVNPYTAAVQGLTEGPGFTGTLFGLHSWLLFPSAGKVNFGWYIVTAMALPLLGSVITGLVVYKKFWRAFTRPRLRLSQGARTFWGDLHRLVGVWSLWFIIVIALSGGWFLVANLINLSGYKVFPEAPKVSRNVVPPPSPEVRRLMPDLDKAVAAAREAMPDFRTNFVRLPESAYSHTVLYGDRGPSLYGKYAYRVYVDPYTDQVGGAVLPEYMTTLQAASRLLPALHFGNFGGLATKLVWFVFGAGLSTMVLSGLIIWTRRTAQATAKVFRPEAKPAPAAAE